MVTYSALLYQVTVQDQFFLPIYLPLFHSHFSIDHNIFKLINILYYTIIMHTILKTCIPPFSPEGTQGGGKPNPVQHRSRGHQQLPRDRCRLAVSSEEGDSHPLIPGKTPVCSMVFGRPCQLNHLCRRKTTRVRLERPTRGNRIRKRKPLQVPPPLKPAPQWRH